MEFRMLKNAQNSKILNFVLMNKSYKSLEFKKSQKFQYAHLIFWNLNSN